MVARGKENWRAEGRCYACGKNPAEPGTNCEDCRSKARIRVNANNRKNKKLVFDHYGRKCACCGETEFQFLEIDHMNNDGAKHRRKTGANNLYLWLKNNNFPREFQVLCRNCNWAKFKLGICPHQQRSV